MGIRAEPALARPEAARLPDPVREKDRLDALGGFPSRGACRIYMRTAMMDLLSPNTFSCEISASGNSWRICRVDTS
jgi:hypothetical protein